VQRERSSRISDTLRNRNLLNSAFQNYRRLEHGSVESRYKLLNLTWKDFGEASKNVTRYRFENNLVRLSK